MTMPVTRQAALLVSLSCCFFARVVAAETATAPLAPASSDTLQEGRTPDLEKARTHFAQGIQFYNAGDYKLSLIEFRRSYELSKNYRILYNIGQVNQQLGNYSNALAALEQYMKQGGDEIESERKTEVAANVAVLKTRVAHVRLVSNVPAPEVLIDGFPVDVSDPSAPITVDPGDHRIDLRKAGYQAGGTVVALAAGDSNEVRVNLVRVPPVVRLTAGNVSGPRRDSTWLWVGWSTTAATALGAGITGLLANSQANELANLRNSSWSTQTQRDNVGRRAKNFAIASDVLTATALAAGATSLYLTFRSEGSSEHERRPAPVTRVALSPTSVSFQQSF
jgi:tetratricopeptide (TPR) repeat protein